MMGAALSSLIPTKVGTQGGLRGVFSLEASSQNKMRGDSWIPAFVGMNGDGDVG